MMWGMENNDVPGRAGATRRAFLSASAVTAVAVPLLGGTALAETDPAISRQAPDPVAVGHFRVEPHRNLQLLPCIFVVLLFEISSREI